MLDPLRSPFRQRRRTGFQPVPGLSGVEGPGSRREDARVGDPCYSSFVRIIAGEFRGRTLLAPHGNTTRPITDRAKQSLFDILAPSLDGALVYDLFSGT